MKYTLGFLLLFLSWLQPLHLSPWVSWHSEVLAFTATVWIFCVALYEQNRSPSKCLAIPSIAALPLAIVLIILAQYFLGMIAFSGDAFIYSIYLFTCIFALVAGFNWNVTGVELQSGLKTSFPVHQMAIAVLAAGVTSVLIEVIQSLDVWGWSEWIVRMPTIGRPGANLGQPNHLATLLVMSIASLVYLFGLQKVSRTFCIFLLLTLELGIAMSGSRSGLVSISVLSVWWLVKCDAPKLKLRAYVFASAGLSFVFLVLMWPPLVNKIYLNGVSDAMVRTDSGLRFLLWPQMLEAVLEKPLWGWGWGEVSKAHNSIAHHYKSSLPFTYAHNIFLDSAIGMGIPLTVLFIGFIAFYVFTRMSASQSKSTWYCIAMCIPLAVHSMFEFPYAYAYFLFPVMLLLGTLEEKVGLNKVINIRLRLMVLTSAVVILLMSLAVKEYISLEEDFQVARFEALKVGSPPAGYESPRTTLLTQLDGVVKCARLVISPGMEPADIDLLGRTAKRFPWSALQYRYALALALNNNSFEATRQLQIIKAMNDERSYARIMVNWGNLALEKYPQLSYVELPSR